MQGVSCLYPRGNSSTGDVDARVHIFTAMALGRGRMATPTLGRLYPRGNSSTGDVDARVHIFTAKALGRGRMATPTLGCLYPQGNFPVLILEEVEWTPGPVWTRRSEENLHPSDTRDRTWVVQPVAKHLAT